jgi:excisionase family DNA binding protein
MTIEEIIDQKIAEKIEPLKRQIEELKPKQYYTRQEAANIFKVSLTTIDLMVKSKELESKMVRGNRRIIIKL